MKDLEMGRLPAHDGKMYIMFRQHRLETLLHPASRDCEIDCRPANRFPSH